jgi:hypothetical protein
MRTMACVAIFRVSEPVHVAESPTKVRLETEVCSWPDGYVPRIGEEVEAPGGKQYRVTNVRHRLTYHGGEVKVLTAFVFVEDRNPGSG